MGKLPYRLNHDLSGLRGRDERTENSCSGRRGRFQGVKSRNTGGELRSTDTPWACSWREDGAGTAYPCACSLSGQPWIRMMKRGPERLQKSELEQGRGASQMRRQLTLSGRLERNIKTYETIREGEYTLKIISRRCQRENPMSISPQVKCVHRLSVVKRWVRSSSSG